MEKKKGLSLQTILTIAGIALIYVLAFLLDRIPGVPIMLTTVLRKGAIYSLVAVSMNLLNGFTGLFSLGQAGFMLLGAYTYAILTVPVSAKDSVYYLYGGSAVNFSLPELFGGGTLGLILGVLAALILAGCVAAVVAWLIGLPVLRLKSDYLAIATLGFAEIIRVVIVNATSITNGSLGIKGILASLLPSLGGDSFAGVTEENAREAMRLAAHKLPIKCKFVKKETEGSEE